MLVDLEGRPLGSPGTQLNDLFLCFSKNLYLHEQLMVYFCYCLSLG